MERSRLEQLCELDAFLEGGKRNEDTWDWNNAWRRSPPCKKHGEAKDNQSGDITREAVTCHWRERHMVAAGWEALPVTCWTK